MEIVQSDLPDRDIMYKNIKLPQTEKIYKPNIPVGNDIDYQEKVDHADKVSR